MSTTLFRPTYCREIKTTKFQVCIKFCENWPTGSKSWHGHIHTTKRTAISCFVTKHTTPKMMSHKCVRMCTGFIVVRPRLLSMDLKIHISSYTMLCQSANHNRFSCLWFVIYVNMCTYVTTKCVAFFKRGMVNRTTRAEESKRPSGATVVLVYFSLRSSWN
jgi:hypothetical protein